MATWSNFESIEQAKPYFKALNGFIAARKQSKLPIYPPLDKTFNAFSLCPLDRLKVVILGQDPYHQPGQAHGLAFSVPKNTPLPPSLRNIFKELSSDLGIEKPTEGDLTPWALQGVFLLNSLLSVEEGAPLSHAGQGWERYTDAVIRYISEEINSVVFLLWGKSAQEKKSLIDETKHAILTAAHPSPLSASRGFFGCRHFSKANKLLISWGKEPIQWDLRTAT